MWDKRYLEMAQFVAQWSKDPERQVGCVLVDELHRVIATGYNGVPRGVDSYVKADRLALTIHAEINALLQAQRSFVTAYTWPYFPCSHCMGSLAQANCQRIVSATVPGSKWRFDLTSKICRDLNIEIILI